MKCMSIMVVLLFANLSATWGQAPRRDVPSLPPVAKKSVVKPTPHTLRVRAATLPASAGRSVTPTTCPGDAVAAGAVCGYVKVPLIREHPGSAKIGIYFELYQHSGAGPAQSVIVANFGGPGLPTASGRGFPLFLFAPNLDVHDLLLIDDRGTGMSGAIDCEELQHGTEPFVDSVADCSEQLGEAASVYGAGDIARDVEAVRAALGYDLVDYFGASYGGADATAYVTRFGQHVRSVVLDAPYGAPALAPFAIEHYRATSDPSVVKLDCLRSPTCAQDHPQPVKEFADLVEDLREHPIHGDAYDAFGNLLHVTLDEKALLNDVVHNVSGDFTNTGELLAAARSWEHGDTAPLLRLEAEGFSTLVGDYGDPVFYSNGAFYATGCSNAQQVWAWSDPYAERKAKYAEAVTDLPADYFAPYSRDAATGLVFSHVGKRCLSWQEGDDKPSPVVPPHAIYPHAPTLVLEGDLDNRVPLAETDKVAASFPNHTAITIAEAGHETVGWSQCARDLVAQFIENLVVGDTRCAGTPETVWPAVGRFPILARDARPAEIDPSGSNQVSGDERKVITVAVATAIDVLQRSFLSFGGDGVGLRGGTFHSDLTSTWALTLTNCQFATDVVVNGSVTWNFFIDNSFSADLVVSGSGTAGGNLHITGFWQAPGPVGNFQVAGTLGGKQVAALVPEA